MTEPPRLTRRHAWWSVAAAVHLLVILLSVAHVPLVTEAQGPAGVALRAYGWLTGADASYGFYAPSVSSPRRVVFAIEDDSGAVTEEVLSTDHGVETINAVKAVLRVYAETESLRRPLAASLARRVFERRPDARRVAVRVEELHIPTMAAYREGERRQWRPLHDGHWVFRRPTGGAGG